MAERFSYRVWCRFVIVFKNRPLYLIPFQPVNLCILRKRWNEHEVSCQCGVKWLNLFLDRPKPSPNFCFCNSSNQYLDFIYCIYGLLYYCSNFMNDIQRFKGPSFYMGWWRPDVCPLVIGVGIGLPPNKTVFFTNACHYFS